MHPRDLLPDELWREIAYHMPFVCFLRGSHRYLRQLIDEDPELWIVDRLSDPMLRDFSEEFRKVAHLKALDGRRGSWQLPTLIYRYLVDDWEFHYSPVLSMLRMVPRHPLLLILSYALALRQSPYSYAQELAWMRTLADYGAIKKWILFKKRKRGPLPKT